MADRILAAAVPGLTVAQRAMIRERARSHGVTALFFDSAAQALSVAREAEIYFGQSPLFTQNAPALRWACTPSAGVDHFLTDGAFLNPSAMLSNSSGAYGVTIAEHIVMVSLMLMRRQPDYEAVVSRREWTRNLPVTSIKGCRVTLLGVGDIGQEAAVRLRAFGPESLTGVSRSGRNPKGLFDRAVPQTELSSVLPETDLLVISLPGTKDTFRMLDEQALSLLPDGAIVVNVGRGSVIDQKALEKELRSGRLSAALDVFETEPIPRDDPFWTCPNLLITPHVAGNMTLPYTVERIVTLFLEDLDRYCAGQPPVRLVDRTRGY